MTHVEIAERLLRCVGEGDVDRAVALCDSSLEFVDVLAPVTQTVRDVRGEAGLRAWFAGLSDGGAAQLTAKPLELEDVGDGRVLGTVLMARGRLAATVHVIWTLRGGRVARIDSFFDRELARREAGLDDTGGLVRRWVEGVVSAKVIGRQSVHLRCGEYRGTEFSVRHSEVWQEIEAGQLGIAETDRGELVSWRPLAHPGRS